MGAPGANIGEQARAVLVDGLVQGLLDMDPRAWQAHALQTESALQQLSQIILALQAHLADLDIPVRALLPCFLYQESYSHACVLLQATAHLVKIAVYENYVLRLLLGRASVKPSSFRYTRTRDTIIQQMTHAGCSVTQEAEGPARDVALKQEDDALRQLVERHDARAKLVRQRERLALVADHVNRRPGSNLSVVCPCLLIFCAQLSAVSCWQLITCFLH